MLLLYIIATWVHYCTQAQYTHYLIFNPWYVWEMRLDWVNKLPQAYFGSAAATPALICGVYSQDVHLALEQFRVGVADPLGTRELAYNS